MTEAHRTEFIRLFEEFAGAFLHTRRGERGVALYRESTENGRENYREVIDAAGRGDDITDLILRKLLPYSNNAVNRSAGAWVHPAPAITKDIRSWFEWGARAKVEEWPDVAKAILHFVRRCVESPGELAAACVDFSELPYTKGLQTGALTPILNANRPDDYSLVNNHARWTLNHFTGMRHSQKLADYPATTGAVQRFVGGIEEEIVRLAGEISIGPAYLYDMFTHWLAKEKKFFRRDEDRVRKVVPTSRTSAVPIDWKGESWEERIARLRRDLTPTERIEARRGWEARARARLERKLGRFDATDLRAFLHEVNGDLAGGGERFNRFIPAFGDPQIALMTKSLDGINRWTERIWTAGDEELEDLLEGFWRSDDVGGAGITYPSLILYLRNPMRWNVWLPVVEEGLMLAWPFTPGKRRTASGYRTYNQALLAFRERNDLPPQAVDLILWEICRANGRQESVSEPGPKPGSGSRGERIGSEPRVAEPAPEPPPIQPEYPLEEIERATGLEGELLTRWARAIERKGQAIIYGPPGTGKTFVADQLARHIVGGGDGEIELVQFHPAYSYEDFVLGIRPETREGKLDYPLVPGRFLQFCDRVRGRAGRSVLIIDEINRANLARVFGELMYLLEYRDRTIPLAGGRRFSVPENVRVIGTMNTADRSIALVDYALRRRFAFLELRPSYDVLLRYHAGNADAELAERLVVLLRGLNAEIDNPHYEIGISFFLVSDLAELLPDIWRTEIEPFLQEYFFDQQRTAGKYRWEEVAKRVLG